MERESFESEEVAKIINESFVSIKVDREERPDVDRVYVRPLAILPLQPLTLSWCHNKNQGIAYSCISLSEACGVYFMQLYLQENDVWCR